MRFSQTFLIVFFTLISTGSFCITPSSAKPLKGDSIRDEISFLKKYFLQRDEWHVTDPLYGRDVEGLIHFIEKQPIDSVLNRLEYRGNKNSVKIIRFPEEVSDSLQIPGYIPASEANQQINKIRKSAIREFMNKKIKVPAELVTGIEHKVKLIPVNEGIKLIKDSIYKLPDSLRLVKTIPVAKHSRAEELRRILKLDSIRNTLIEKYRNRYNDSIVRAYRDSVIYDYQEKALQKLIDAKVRHYTDSVEVNNHNLIMAYNDKIVRNVNDSVFNIINDLVHYAGTIDTNRINILNINNKSTGFTLGNGVPQYSRIWLKNKQQDSISVLLQNLNKNNLKMTIDDNVIFNRFSRRAARGIELPKIPLMVNLEHINSRYKVETPWRIGGDGTVGFTQTYLDNWSTGGQSALSMLLVLKGFANYSSSDNKIKWENSVEIRNGWLKPGGTDENGDKYEAQKNDDKFEYISRFGISAFRKWYYSAEIDFQTQFFNGYNYPTSLNPKPISAFLSPAETFYKLGLDYKPNKKLSVLLSPLTSKTIFVRDTLKVDKSNYNIPDGKRKLWVPGLNADIGYKSNLSPDISYETKYKMFVNYTKPFKQLDVDWENLVVMKINSYINMRLMLHLIYDPDVLFPVKDSNGNELYKKPKLQVKELVSVGFSYMINREVYRTHRIN